jgi:hypothetical protein
LTRCIRHVGCTLPHVFENLTSSKSAGVAVRSGSLMALYSDLAHSVPRRGSPAKSLSSSGNVNRTRPLITRVRNHPVFKIIGHPKPYSLGEDVVETFHCMFRRCSGATHDRRLGATAPTAIIGWSAIAGSRSRTIAFASAGRSKHHWASATTACGRSARRGPSAASLQGRPFPRGARRQ